MFVNVRGYLIASVIIAVLTASGASAARLSFPAESVPGSDAAAASQIVGTDENGKALRATFEFVVGGGTSTEEPAFARLVIPSHLCVCTNSLRLEICSRSKSIEWIIKEAWGTPESKRPVWVPSGDIRSLMPDAEMRGASRVLVLSIGPSQHSAATRAAYIEVVDDRNEGDEVPHLEIYEQLGDTFVGSELVGRPTRDSATINTMSLVPLDLYVEYGDAAGSYGWATGTKRTELPEIDPLVDRPAMEPIEIQLTDLAEDSEYHYRVRYRRADEGEYQEGKDRKFRTARRHGECFRFAITADEHLQNKILHGHTQALADYAQTLENVGAADPDFLISLGDFAHPELYQDRDAATSFETVQRYLDVRRYIDKICHSVPFYLVLGNHEAEQGWRLDGGRDNLAVRATLARKKVIPNPCPDDFYSGSEDSDPLCGKRENYYAWTWGDALFVVLDPYWHTMRNPKRESGDNWDWTLGRDQYEWLYQTLHDSEAKWKFVFSHQVTGGTTLYGRGGIECAKYKVKGLPSYEWGGEDEEGRDVFAEKRPGWTHGAIHDLLVGEGVTAFFHGHDHLFVHQELDGIVYQECPTPGDEPYSDGHGPRGKYELGHFERSPGFLLVEVCPERVNVDYVKTNVECANAKTVYSYSMRR